MEIKTCNLTSPGYSQTTFKMGLQRLVQLTKLDSLNLDCITKRDISTGLSIISEEGRLMRNYE
ncbi:hypothetical protein DICVIV_13580 [Dictyocaulus viviparus]|uniref:Uncharacterized protein n=1 Tax=Dictyocaulus viviparus TaxID=29172 RepID=A0A0D8X7D6_DICVI|nr:hypothetical protein DICVIV_13580 [Dictyocaulus viviparus]